jgi:phosphatidylinositol glycan class B
MQLINIHFLVLVGLALRLGVSFVSERINHADEIFQYLEQAHRLVFGYGYIPWEYRYGTRSWILPGFISVILFLCKSLGGDSPAIYIGAVQVVFCVLSISLIYSVYVLAREIGGETAAKLAALFTCFWYELLFFADKPNPEILGTYLIAAALAMVVSKTNSPSTLLFGLLAAVAVVLRIQYLPPIAVVAFFACVRWREHEIATSALTFFITLTVAGFIDYVTWGDFFASYYNNYLYNTVYGISKLFGTEPFSYYFKSLTIASAGVFAITGLLSLFKLEKTWLPLSVVASIILSHSLIPHKEYRFVFATIPMFLALLSICIADEGVRQRESIGKGMIGTAIMIMCFLSLMGLFSNLPWQERVVNRGLQVPLLAKEEILQAYLFLNKEPGLAAILDTSAEWFLTGGYYYLHRNIPIYSTEHLELSDDLHFYVSHIVCPTDEKHTPGFATLLKMKTLEIRRQINPPSRYALLGVDTKIVLQEGIDDKFTPTVKKRL